ncbi:MAG: hypothetical protein A2163_07940 [Actinobacteria bacterium RBG_13_35_12]|nr:MAG: hypothetical protein A2163_07940 [Actinobacteria bacterium RBG_13_35_12]
MAQPNNEEKEDTEILDFDQPNFKFNPNEYHEWRQQGPYLVCRNCELIHAIYVGMDKLLVGLDSEGRPLFKKR